MIRILRWALVGAAAVWLTVTVVNWLSGDFWWWGGGAPLVAFFAVPLLVVASVPMLALRRRVPARLDRAAVSLAAAAFALIAARRVFSGRTWLWVLPDLVIPPLLFLVTPLALLAAVPFVARTRWWTAGLATAALALGATQAGVHLGGGGGPAPAGAVRVVSWDTYCWNTDDDAARFFRYLKDRRADLYLLQEHSGCGPGAPTPIDDADLLRREFPGHEITALDGLLTVSRFPVVGQKPVGAAHNPYAPNWRHAALRTDLDIGGRTVSVYNVHLFDMLYLSASPLSPRFYQAIQTLDAARQVQIDALADDVDANPNPILASGNFNALPGMGHLRRLDHLAAAEGPHYPATLSFAGLRLWRMDWTFTSPGLTVHRYDLRSPDGLSTHHLQELLISEA
ncbi:endonuclease/exonuclease/phosphatase family protein [Herbidospora mongoliensis]|uniref:endonuclease/exonuclease/phosphatase family protein n=1 Tax=Herbidospora mongoliensis TaxID=688067 RepID=UPI000A00C39C|nr:endonuclease/exonuclease/phosphatase family protein [Herbidospora mongoliensis]